MFYVWIVAAKIEPAPRKHVKKFCFVVSLQCLPRRNNVREFTPRGLSNTKNTQIGASQCSIHRLNVDRLTEIITGRKMQPPYFLTRP